MEVRIYTLLRKKKVYAIEYGFIHDISRKIVRLKKYEDGIYSTEEYQHFAVIHMQELQSKKLHNIEIELNEFQVQMVMDNLPLYKDGAQFSAVSSVREKNENETVM